MGAAEALQSLLSSYQDANPGARVSLYTDISASTWKMVLNDQIDDGLWDVFQLAAADLPGFRTNHPTSLSPVDAVYDDKEFAKALLPEARDAVSLDGHVYGVVTGIHRNNAFIFNKQILDANGVEPPTTVQEFLEACKTLKAAGVTPVAATFQSWALRILFDDILQGTIGAAAFDDFVSGRTPVTDPAISDGIHSTIDTLDVVLKEYVDVPTSSDPAYGWSGAAQTLHDGNAAMMFNGDWVKGFLIQQGWTPDVDFGVSGPPGAFDVFVYGADMFGMPSSAPNPKQAEVFLRYVSSKEGQVAFNTYKGSTPCRRDVRDQLDSSGQATLDAFVNAKVRSPSHANDTWTTAIGAFAMDGDKDALFEVYRTTPP